MAFRRLARSVGGKDRPLVTYIGSTSVAFVVGYYGCVWTAPLYLSTADAGEVVPNAQTPPSRWSRTESPASSFQRSYGIGASPTSLHPR
jgi:hypothetical protein